MQRIAALPALLQVFACALLTWSTFAWPAPASAQSVTGQRTIITARWVEEWDPRSQRWVKVDESEALAEHRSDEDRRARWGGMPRVGFEPQTQQPGFGTVRSGLDTALAQYGPFLVLSQERAAIVGSTDAASPAQFDAMIQDFPGLKTLDMVEAPGTSHDIANLAVGRRIRAHGIATHVPSYGSVRSGAVELFLAGAQRSVDQGAWFAVHSWIDNYGREPEDFAPNDPANRLYLDYYKEMGMSDARAAEFYAMTNSVPHHSAKWLRADEMRAWIRLEAPASPGPDATARSPAFAAHWDVSNPSLSPAIGYLDVTKVNLASLETFRAQPFLDS